MSPHIKPPSLCPSAQAHEAGAQVFAVVGGTLEEPSVSYLDRPMPMSPELVEMTAPVDPAEVFRISAPCAGSRCSHFSETQHNCRLATRTVALAPVVVSKPPRCAIRTSCVWWSQEGVGACLRCPQVVTNDYMASDRVREAADPTNLRFGA